jgi:dTDP-4-dehydrorhamnose 3,5-epimerase
MHYQTAPHEEAKLVRCTRGSLYDVLLDLRPDSQTYCEWAAVTLTAADGAMVYIPEGVAHGFQTLEDITEVFYQISAPYCPESACGVRWDDPTFEIRWPIDRPILSRRDATFPDFVRQAS